MERVYLVYDIRGDYVEVEGIFASMEAIWQHRDRIIQQAHNNGHHSYTIHISDTLPPETPIDDSAIRAVQRQSRMNGRQTYWGVTSWPVKGV